MLGQCVASEMLISNVEIITLLFYKYSLIIDK